MDSLAPLSAHQGLLFRHQPSLQRLPTVLARDARRHGWPERPVPAGREAHNCNLSRGTDRVSFKGRSPGRGRAKPVDTPTMGSTGGELGAAADPAQVPRGSGEASATTALTTPSAPQNVTATPGDREMTLTWSAPSSDGGSAVSLYRIYYREAAGTGTFGNTSFTSDVVFKVTFSGLANGTSCEFGVHAMEAGPPAGRLPRSPAAASRPPWGSAQAVRISRMVAVQAAVTPGEIPCGIASADTPPAGLACRAARWRGNRDVPRDGGDIAEAARLHPVIWIAAQMDTALSPAPNSGRATMNARSRMMAQETPEVHIPRILREISPEKFRELIETLLGAPLQNQSWGMSRETVENPTEEQLQLPHDRLSRGILLRHLRGKLLFETDWLPPGSISEFARSVAQVTYLGAMSGSRFQKADGTEVECSDEWARLMEDEEAGAPTGPGSSGSGTVREGEGGMVGRRRRARRAEIPDGTEVGLPK